jgi:hypothetical protein
VLFRVLDAAGDEVTLPPGDYKMRFDVVEEPVGEGVANIATFRIVEG